MDTTIRVDRQVAKVTEIRSGHSTLQSMHRKMDSALGSVRRKIGLRAHEEALGGTTIGLPEQSAIKKYAPMETSTRTLGKAFSYRIGSVLTVGPASAWFIQGVTTGHWNDPTAALKTFGLPTMVGGAVFNTTHYYLIERGYVRIHSGYEFLKEHLEHSKSEKSHEKSKGAQETHTRTVWKTLSYRGTALVTATPLAAIFTGWWVTGHLDPNTALKVYYGAAAAASIIFNSAYYYGAERAYAHVKRGYIALRSIAEQEAAKMRKEERAKRDDYPIISA